MRSLILVMLAISLPGCGGAEQDAISMDHGIQRVVTLAPHLAEMMFAVGAEAQLAGTVSYSDYPPEAARVPRIGDAFRVDAEQIALIDPDLILAWPQGNPSEMLGALAASGYRVVGLDTTDIESVATQIEQVGELTGHAAQAEVIANRLREKIAALGSAYEDRVPVSVFYQISAKPLYTIGGRQIISDVIELCGGRNIFSDLDELAPVVGVESILERDPEVMISAPINDENPLSIWDSFDELTAVREQHRYLVNAELLARAGPRMADGMREMCELIDRARR